MKHSMKLMSGLVLFGAGILAGRYGAVMMPSPLYQTEVNLPASRSPVIPQSPLAPPTEVSSPRPTPSPLASPTEVGSSKPLSSLLAPSNEGTRATKRSSAEPDSSGVPPLPPRFELTPEAQAQWMAQQREAMQAQIDQLNAMIQSMTENGLPQEDINAFIEIKRAMEEQRAAEPNPTEANRLEPTIEEIKNDFAASLDPADIPPAERSRLIEDLFSSRELFPERMDDLPVEPPLPAPVEERTK